jgi:hypothetical protein
MRRSPFLRSLLAAFGLGLGAGLAAAGEPIGPPTRAEPIPAPHPVMAGTPVLEHAPARHGLIGWIHSRPIRSWLNSPEPHGCYSHFNDYSCSSLDSECKFLFGGCRVFFGERCLKGPPPSPLPGFDIHTLSWIGPDGRRGPSGWGRLFDEQTGYQGGTGPGAYPGPGGYYPGTTGGSDCGCP